MINQGLVLTCPKCSTKNFLDPYPFWNFQGNTKCASCDALYAMKFVNGQLLSGPTAATGKGRPSSGLRRRQDRGRHHR